MTKKTIAIIIWVLAAFIFLIVGLAAANSHDDVVVIGDSPHSRIQASEPSSAASSASTSVDAPSPGVPSLNPTVKPRPAGPATFVMPNFVNMDENEVESWFDSRNIRISLDIDYGEDEWTDCSDAGDGIVEDQTPGAGTKLTNDFSTAVYLAVYCEY